MADSGIEHTVLALTRKVEHQDARVVKAPSQFYRAVTGAIAGDDDLQRGEVLILGQQVAQFVLDMAFLVVRRDHHADLQRWQQPRLMLSKEWPSDGQQQRVAKPGIEGQQQTQPKDEFSHGRASLRSS
ncbi:hypothetical protein D3C79_947040 [compost metagenome]